MVNENNHRFWNLLSKKLANAATDVELKELSTILVSNPNLHHQADLITEMWEQHSRGNNFSNEAAYMRHVMKHKDEFFTNESKEAVDTHVIDGALEEERPSFLRPVFSRRLTIISFVALILVASGTIYLLSGRKNRVASAEQEISSVVTKNGNRTKIVLPDGSQVWLNAGSSLDYNNSSFNKELREVSLNGEAYFDVTKNESKPFIIHTKKMDIKVVGTSFNVRSYNDEKMAEAALITGTIEVTLKDRTGQKIVLRPNEKISVPNTDSSEVTSKSDKKVAIKENPKPVFALAVDHLRPNPVTNIIPEIAWTQNRLYFDDSSLEDIAPMLERWFAKKVVILKESLKKISYTGNYENESLETVLMSLKLSKHFDYKIENDTVIIY